MTTALLIIDMQNDFVAPDAILCVKGARATIPTLQKLLTHARETKIPVIHVIREHEHDGSDAEKFRRHLFANGKTATAKGTKGAEIIPELKPIEGETIIIKKRFSAFFGTELEEFLTKRGITHLVVSGTQYPNCIRGTAADAVMRDYDVTVVTDACSAQTEDVAKANIYDMQRMGIECISFDEYLKKEGERK